MRVLVSHEKLRGASYMAMQPDHQHLLVACAGSRRLIMLDTSSTQFLPLVGESEVLDETPGAVICTAAETLALCGYSIRRFTSDLSPAQTHSVDRDTNDNRWIEVSGDYVYFSDGEYLVKSQVSDLTEVKRIHCGVGRIGFGIGLFTSTAIYIFSALDDRCSIIDTDEMRVLDIVRLGNLNPIHAGTSNGSLLFFITRDPSRFQVWDVGDREVPVLVSDAKFEPGVVLNSVAGDSINSGDFLLTFEHFPAGSCERFDLTPETCGILDFGLRFISYGEKGIVSMDTVYYAYHAYTNTFSRSDELGTESYDINFTVPNDVHVGRNVTIPVTLAGQPFVTDYHTVVFTAAAGVTIVSGGTLQFGNADWDTPQNLVLSAAAGTYVMRYVVTPNIGHPPVTGTMDVTVLAAPTIDAGIDQSITLPSTALMAATAGGFYDALLWTKVSGPGTAAFVSAGLEDPVVTFSVAGVYVLRCTLTYNGGTTVHDDVTITASAAVVFSSLSMNGSVLGSFVSGTIAYLVGNFTAVTDANGTYTRNHAAALDMTTGLFTAWNPNLNGTALCCYVIGSTVYLGGYFDRTGGNFRANISAVDTTNGTYISGFNVTMNAPGHVAAFAYDGTNLYIGGDFEAGASLYDFLFRVNPTNGATVAWTQIAFPHRLDGIVNDLLFLNGNIYACGAFTHAASVARDHLAKFDCATGAIDTSFLPSLSLGGGTVNALETFGTKIIWGGTDAAGGALASVEIADGSATAWTPAIDSTVGSTVLDLHVDGTDVIVGGRFSTIGGQSFKGIARLDAVTGLASTAFDPEVHTVGAAPGPGNVYSIAIYSGDMVVGGFFDTVDGATHNSLAILNKTTGALA